MTFCSSYDIIFILSGLKQYLWRPRYLQISYEMVSNAHVRELTVSFQQAISELR